MASPRIDYRRLIELSPDAILISQDGQVVFVNPAAIRLCGASTAADLLGKSPLDVFHPDSHARIRHRLDRQIAGEPMPLIEDRIVRLDGGVTDVEISGTVLEEPDGHAAQIIVRDITERKRAEAALRESEERLTLAFAGAQEGVWDWNLETGSVVYSPRWKEMLGYDDQDIEPHVSAWERLLHPDDKAIADQLNERVARGDPTYEGEFRLRHKDGPTSSTCCRADIRFGASRAGPSSGSSAPQRLRLLSLYIGRSLNPHI